MSGKQSALLLATSVVAVVVCVACGEDAGPAALDVPPLASAVSSVDPLATIAPGSPEATAPIVPPLDLTGVTPESVPIVVGEQLGTIQLAVRNTLSDDVFTGASVENADSQEITQTIYGTDVSAIESVLDQIAGDLRTRISVVERQFSRNELQSFADTAVERLQASSIQVGYAGLRVPFEVIEVQLETPDGLPDPEIEASAWELLGDLPVSIAFSGPPVPLGPLVEP